MIKKYSISISGHQTSITLEPIFWELLGEIAATKQLSKQQLIHEIDQKRALHSPAPNLSSALRVFVVEEKLNELHAGAPA